MSATQPNGLPFPTKVNVKVDKANDRIVKTHPSFGMISFSRISGSSGPMFGSQIEVGSFIRLAITEADETWHLHQKWRHGGKRIIELDLTNAQFAEAITTMNRGEGIPSTLRFVKGDGHIPGFIGEPTLHEQIQADVKEAGASIVERADKLAADMAKLLAESGLSKAKQAALQASLAMLRQDLTANMPFIIDQHAEAVEKITADAKTEGTRS